MEWTRRVRSSSRCSMRLIPGSSARSTTLLRARSSGSNSSMVNDLGDRLRQRLGLRALFDVATGRYGKTSCRRHHGEIAGARDGNAFRGVVAGGQDGMLGDAGWLVRGFGADGRLLRRGVGRAHIGESVGSEVTGGWSGGRFGRRRDNVRRGGLGGCRSFESGQLLLALGLLGDAKLFFH